MQLPSIEKIVAPVDGSEVSVRALPWVLTLAQLSGASVDLVGVVADLNSRDENSAMRSHLAEASVELHRIAPRVTEIVEYGSSANFIVDHAARTNADLIVMGSHARSRLMRRLLGSVTAEVLRKSTTPVMVTKPHHSAYFIDRVVVSLDGTELGAGALHYACELARLASVSLEVLHVAESLNDLDEQNQLARITAELTDIPVEYEVVIESGTARARLATYIDQIPGSVLVMGSAGATGYGPNRRGSVASRVIENSDSPTLVVPPTKYLGNVIE